MLSFARQVAPLVVIMVGSSLGLACGETKPPVTAPRGAMPSDTMSSEDSTAHARGERVGRAYLGRNSNEMRYLGRGCVLRIQLGLGRHARSHPARSGGALLYSRPAQRPRRQAGWARGSPRALRLQHDARTIARGRRRRLLDIARNDQRQDPIDVARSDGRGGDQRGVLAARPTRGHRPFGLKCVRAYLHRAGRDRHRIPPIPGMAVPLGTFSSQNFGAIEAQPCGFADPTSSLSSIR